MATVGNLFVNVRGRTNGFVQDIKKANRKVSKDFYRNEAMAMQRVREARDRVGRLTGASDERFQAAIAGLRRAEAGVEIARNRVGKTAERRQLMGQKERGQQLAARIARETRAVIPLVFGVPAAALALSVREGFKAMGEVRKFAPTGPAGGEFIAAKIGKTLDDLAFAQRPDVSRVMAKTAQLERETAQLWRETGLQLQVFINAVLERFFGDSLSMTPPPIKGDPGFRPGVVDVEAGARQRQRADNNTRRKEADRMMDEAWSFFR